MVCVCFHLRYPGAFLRIRSGCVCTNLLSGFRSCILQAISFAYICVYIHKRGQIWHLYLRGKQYSASSFEMGSHLRQIDSTLLRRTHTWVYSHVRVRVSVCRVRLHPLTLNSPDTEVYLPACLTTRLLPPTLCKF